MLEAEARDRIMVALDCDGAQARAYADTLAGRAVWVKIGMTLFYAEGPSIVSYFKERGFKVFLDLKLHDIPHQVRGAARAAALTGADLVTVHGLGSRPMLEAAREGAQEASEVRGGERARIIAVTVLTSMDEAALNQIGVTDPVAVEAARLAALARDARIDGVVCSPQEASAMRELLGPDAWVVTPGVRPAGAALGDQSRVATPAAAIAAGASHLVIGRPITEAADPVVALEAIVDELVQQTV